MSILLPRLITWKKIASIIILTLFNISSLAGCAGCRQEHPIAIMNLSTAQQEADKIGKLLQQVPDTHLKNIMDEWGKAYIDYFTSKSNGAGQLFFDSSNEASGYALSVATTGRQKKWSTLLAYRNMLEHALNALNHAFVSPQARSKAINEVQKVKGGCSGISCPQLTAKDVAPEIKKITIYLDGIKTMLPQLQTKNKTVYEIAQQAISLGEKAIGAFHTQTNGYNKELVDKNPKEQEALFYAYVRSATLFTITLKELSHITTFVWDTTKKVS